MKRLILACPFLWATAPVLFLFTYNMGEVDVEDLPLPMLVVAGVTLACLLLARRLVKNRDRAVIIVSFVMFWVFAYGYLEDAWQSFATPIAILGRTALATLVLWGSVLITVPVLVLRTHRSLGRFTSYLSVMGLALVAISLANMGVFAIRAATVDSTVGNAPEEHAGATTASQAELPDIYYIILDSYTSADAMLEFFDFDNSEFIDHLAEKGFYVALQSRSNYITTPASLSSSLDMSYLDYLGEVYGESSQDVGVLWEMAADSKVSRFLKARGYNYASIATATAQRTSGPIEDDLKLFENQSRFGVSYFTSSLLQRTPLRPVISHLISLDHRGIILFGFDALANVASDQSPVFIFGHIVSPHAPYVFDRNGDTPEGEGSYVEQVMFVNGKIETLIDELLEKSSVPPIIVLQGDTGHGGGSQTHILNAYLFPDRNYERLYQTITPVNTFRVILSQYLGADFELLVDESYRSSYKEPFRFSLIE